MTTPRIFNFSAGPAVLPEEVLVEARDNLLSLGASGIGILECSHRSKDFEAIISEAESNLRELLGIPTGYRVLFLSGGATMQFSMVPMNLLVPGTVEESARRSQARRRNPRRRHHRARAVPPHPAQRRASLL